MTSEGYEVGYTSWWQLVALLLYAVFLFGFVAIVCYAIIQVLNKIAIFLGGFV